MRPDYPNGAGCRSPHGYSIRADERDRTSLPSSRVKLSEGLRGRHPRAQNRLEPRSGVWKSGSSGQRGLPEGGESFWGDGLLRGRSQPGDPLPGRDFPEHHCAPNGRMAGTGITGKFPGENGPHACGLPSLDERSFNPGRHQGDLWSGRAMGQDFGLFR